MNCDNISESKSFSFFFNFEKLKVFIKYFFLFLINIINVEKTQRLVLKNIITGVFTLELKLSEFNSECVNMFPLCLMCLRQTTHAVVTSS